MYQQSFHELEPNHEINGIVDDYIGLDLPQSLTVIINLNTQKSLNCKHNICWVCSQPVTVNNKNLKKIAAILSKNIGRLGLSLRWPKRFYCLISEMCLNGMRLQICGHNICGISLSILLIMYSAVLLVSSLVAAWFRPETFIF